MNLSLLTLPITIAKHLTVEASDAFVSAIRDFGHADLDGSIDVETVASGVLRAVLPKAPEGFENAALRTVDLFTEGRSVRLTPAESSLHPLLRDWAAPTLMGAVAQVILGGAAYTSLAPDAPVFENINIRAFGTREVAATAEMAFQGRAGAMLKARLFYGEAPERCGLSTLVMMTGNALFGIGLDSIGSQSSSHSLEQDATLHAAASAAHAAQLTGAQDSVTVH